MSDTEQVILVLCIGIGLLILVAIQVLLPLSILRFKWAGQSSLKDWWKLGATPHPPDESKKS